MYFPSFDRRQLPAGLRLAEASGADGWRLRAYDWPVEGRPRGSILFQTGRGDFIEKYVEALAHWHASGWQVSGFDWRGQGGSAREGAIGSADSLDAMLADLAGHVAAWIALTPAPHVLIGHSMGGHLLLRLLAERADIAGRIDAAVLVAPMLGLAHAPLPAGAARGLAGLACATGFGARPLWRERLSDPGRQARLTGSVERYADEEHWRVANPLLRVDPPSWGWLAAAFGSIARLDAPGVLEAVSTPILIVATERDRLVSAAAIRRAAARLPNATLTMIDGAHELLREADGARLAAFAAIDGFLDAQVAA